MKLSSGSGLLLRVPTSSIIVNVGFKRHARISSATHQRRLCLWQADCRQWHARRAWEDTSQVGSYRYIVEIADLAPYIKTKLLQKCMVNNKVACYLRRKRGGPVPKNPSKYRSFTACGDSLCHSTAGNGPYCSIQCMLGLICTPMLENLASVAASDQIDNGRSQTVRQKSVAGNPQAGATHEAPMELPPRTVETTDPRPTMDFARLFSRFLGSR